MAQIFRDVYDLVVVGGGPAGCASALTAARLAPDAKILLLESGAYPRQKVCGEFITAEGMNILHAMGPGSDFIHNLINDGYNIDQTNITLPLASATITLNPPGTSISRNDLDWALWRHCIKLGIVCQQQLTVQRITQNGHFTLHTHDGALRARSVINAAGRWSRLNAMPSIPSRRAPWLGIKAHFNEDSPRSSVDLYLFRGGYCGVQPAGHNQVNVCAMLRADVATRLTQVFRLHPALEERSRAWTPASEILTTAPLLFQTPVAARDGIFQTGDAAGFIDPFVGDGITLALLSGRLAGAAVAEVLHGKQHLRAALVNYQEKYAQEVAPLFRRVAWLRKLLALPRALQLPALAALRLPWLAQVVVHHARPQRFALG
jgi:flavin-dependent dehydrogenase